MTRTLQKLLWFRTSDIFITKNKDSKQNLTTYITRNVQQEKLEKQKKITVAKFLVWEKKDIVGAKTFETRGELNLNLHVLARRSRDKKQKQLQMHERERERERERENKNDERIGGKERSKRGGGARCTKQTHCKTLVRSITIYTPDTSTYYLKHVVYTLYNTVYIFPLKYYTIYILLSSNLFEEKNKNKIIFVNHCCFIFFQFNLALIGYTFVTVGKLPPQN
jgi:hypothetical protein